jgi:hypothetical protein
MDMDDETIIFFKKYYKNVYKCFNIHLQKL